MPVTLKDIARELGISVTTVSRALAGYSDVAEETRQRVREQAAAMGYTPNRNARRLVGGRTGTIGFVMPTAGPRFSDPFFSEFIAGVGNEAAEHEYDLLVSTHAPGSEGEMKAYRRAAAGSWVDGLIVVRTREQDRRVRLLCNEQFPFVAFGRTADECDFPFVDEDGREGMRRLVHHFIERGHRRIALIAPPSGLMFGRYRLQGFYEAMAAAGLPVRPEWVVEGKLTQQSGARAAQTLLALQPRPTAMIGGNDLMAIGAMNSIRAAGLEPGAEIAIGGFDDIPLSAFVSPPLTTMRQPIYEIGRKTCAMLLDIVSGRQPESRYQLLTPQLVVRASSGPAHVQGGDA